MFNRAKNTLAKEVSFSGLGIHSGKSVDICLKPSDSGEILFRRTDRNNLELQIDPKHIEAQNSISLTAGVDKIQTIEHLMATLYVLDLDSLIIELNGPEIPIMDGSASPFVDKILGAGIKPLSKRKKVINITKPYAIEENKASISVFPDSDLSIDYFIEYDHPAILNQEYHFSVNCDDFVRDIAPARTFGFLKDVPAMRDQGLALGGSFENAVVLSENGILNEPLRFPDEFVRHKILDFIGDLSLMGSPVTGHFQAVKAGHSLHLKMVNFLLENPGYWTYV